MEHDVLDHDLDCKACRANAREFETHLVWRNNLWVLRHIKPPYAALGWMTLHSQRHAPALTQLSAEELADLGPTIARISQVIIDITGALQVYIASMTEVTPHFHAHLIPRYADGPKGWEAYKLKEQAKVSPQQISDVAVAEVIKGVADRLAVG